MPEVVEPQVKHDRVIERVIEKQPYIIKTIEKLPPQPRAVDGLAVGINGMYPTLSFTDKDTSIEIGYTNRNGNQSVLVCGQGVAWRKGWTRVKVGLELTPGGTAAWGFGICLEQYLTKDISLSGTIYPVRSGNGTNITGDTGFGARVYF